MSMSQLNPLEPLLAGTLVLLHHHAARDANTPPCPYAAYKLAHNLHRLANHPTLSEPMAVVLARLATLWRERAHAATLTDLARDDAGDVAEGRTALH